MIKLNLREALNLYGKRGEPFLFIIDFNLKEFYISSLRELDSDILVAIDLPPLKAKKFHYTYKAIDFNRYKRAFNRVIDEIKKGNTYLLNLTFPSEIEIDASLKEIFYYSDAKYRLYFKDKFVCFSPESFIEIRDNKIYTYPMKGTIDANIPNAKEIILNDAKEMAEHTMVVDLLRNDLGVVADSIKVEEFRYPQTIQAGSKRLIQISSKISGLLRDNWQESLGDILLSMLPAGSISGTPKRKTLEIIREVEGYDRGFFSGIFGVYKNRSLKSGVMIRFIEKVGGKLYYKSGGGITLDSDIFKEYKELQEKIYVPTI